MYSAVGCCFFFFWEGGGVSQKWPERAAAFRKAQIELFTHFGIQLIPQVRFLCFHFFPLHPSLYLSRPPSCTSPTSFRITSSRAFGRRELVCVSLGMCIMFVCASEVMYADWQNPVWEALTLSFTQQQMTSQIIFPNVEKTKVCLNWIWNDNWVILVFWRVEHLTGQR